MQEGRVKSQCPHWKYVTDAFILVILPISRTQEILLCSSWEGCIQLTVVILTFKIDGFFFC